MTLLKWLDCKDSLVQELSTGSSGLDIVSRYRL
jgi:hypothetical protein